MVTATERAGVLITGYDGVCLVRSLRGDQWVLPKGHIDPGETVEEAAVREAWEETGQHVSLDKRLQDTYFNIDFTGENVTCHWFLAAPAAHIIVPAWLSALKQDGRPVIWVSNAMALDLVKIPDLISVIKEGTGQ